jgi:hypothetical protein
LQSTGSFTKFEGIMNEERFWAMIEEAWQSAGGMENERGRLAKGKLSEDAIDDLMCAMDDMVGTLRDNLFALDQQELLQFDRILEKKLFEIDRAEVQAQTDGSNDGFLYARGFIVAAGKEYYEAVKAKAKLAVTDAECEEMCYLSFHVYEDRFGDMPQSGISRESCSNKAGWRQLARE